MSLLAPAFLREELEREPNYLEHLIDDIRSEHKDEMNAIRVCARKGVIKDTIRFISSKDQVDDISSTRIRQIIEAGTPETLQDRLESFALNPDILLNIIQTRGWHGLSRPAACSSTEFWAGCT
ncbi:hypothetical protein DM02DRAFT_602932 [Periconia macrospinosa]|uniref:Uncharacterized protein n=1 Tax=Periconia macrospinosa TaxID=97972 RepID=A0A2V1DAI7_9PLEO|nr:hypothetical protein DM02DRAFT_602932 [Periconia macrospinosa]